ncbi:MAG: hypothetical protein Q7R85_00750 [bacterium]|nr:hypothetical protein [bacterium]
MLALVTLSTWQTIAIGALVALLLVLWLSARRWSVERLVMVRAHYKDGAEKDFITYPWRLKELYKAIKGNPRTLHCDDYFPRDLPINSSVTCVSLHPFGYHSHPWHNNDSLQSHFQWERTLWSSAHALLTSVLSDFGLEDNQPMLPEILNLLSHQRLDALRLKAARDNPSAAYCLNNGEVAYLQRLRDCLDVTMEKRWARDTRYVRLNGGLPDTDACVMTLLDTDEGAKCVIAYINRGWQPEPTPPMPPEPCIQTRTGGHC